MNWKGLALVCGLVAMSSSLWAADSKAATPVPQKLYYEDLYGSRTGIQQFYDILQQLQRAMGDIPPDMERLAVYNIRADRNDFSPGLVKFFQGKIEETFTKYGHKQIIVAPDLRQTRILSTDTSFTLSNTLPNQEDLWRLGEKLRLNGFIEGSLTQSDDGDVLLNLKVFRHKTAEVVWSGSFVSGPNRPRFLFPLLEVGTRLTFGYWPVERYTDNDTTVSGSNLKLAMYQYGAEFTVGEAANSSRRLFLGASGGLSFLFPVADDPEDSLVGDLPSNWVGMAGADLLYVFIPKANMDDGFWLGAYLGLRVYFPQKIIALRHGYTSRITRHFAISAGIQYLPLLDQLIASKSFFSSGSDYQLKLQNPTYEVSIQYAL
ncbi:MAG TPA: hypothetical protein VLM37_00625 [Fibrobacteraceae bacterium]|nr:hypothetical protein [Fibrobacteraceae bacterium]